MLQVVHEFKLKMMEVRTFSDLKRSRKGDLEGVGGCYGPLLYRQSK